MEYLQSLSSKLVEEHFIDRVRSPERHRVIFQSKRPNGAPSVQIFLDAVAVQCHLDLALISYIRIPSTPNNGGIDDLVYRGGLSNPPSVFRTMATSINDLPVEIITRIITIGCEDLPDRLYYASERRKLKPLALVASMVCQDWHSIVMARSNYHLWSTKLLLAFLGGYSYFDTTEEIAKFRDLLSKSSLGDLDLDLRFPGLLEDPSSLVERLFLHTFTFLVPYSHQIRRLTIGSRPTRAVISILYSLKPLTRLEEFKLYFFRPGTYGLTVRRVHDWRYRLANIGPIDCQWTAARCRYAIGDSRGETRFPDHISSITLDFDETLIAKWSDIAMLLKENPRLKTLSLGPFILKDAPPVSSESHGDHESKPSETQILLEFLEVVDVRADIGTLFTFMTYLRLPRIESLDLDILDTKDFDVQPIPGPPKDSPPPLRVSSLRVLELLFHEKTWMKLHDSFIQTILPPSMTAVVLRFAEEVSECHPLHPAPADTSPQFIRPVVSTLISASEALSLIGWVFSRDGT